MIHLMTLMMTRMLLIGLTSVDEVLLFPPPLSPVSAPLPPTSLSLTLSCLKFKSHPSPSAPFLRITIIAMSGREKVFVCTGSRSFHVPFLFGKPTHPFNWVPRWLDSFSFAIWYSSSFIRGILKVGISIDNYHYFANWCARLFVCFENCVSGNYRKRIFFKSALS